jgi:hypothetical protein
LTDITELEEPLDPYIAARLPGPGRPVDGEVLVVFRGHMPGVYRSRFGFEFVHLLYVLTAIYKRWEFIHALGFSRYAFWDSFATYADGRNAWVEALQKGHLVAF